MAVKRVAILLITAVYLLTPYSVKKLNGGCECGCREIICHCCTSPKNFCDVTSISKCRCQIEDESYSQSPGIISPPLEMAMTFYETGNVIAIGGSFLPGYKDPPMRPPPA